MTETCRCHGWSYRRMFLEILAVERRYYAAFPNGLLAGIVAM